MSEVLAFLTSFSIIPLIIIGILGFLLGWLLRGSGQAGDLSVEGEGKLRADADGLRARVKELEGHVSSRDGDISDLKGKLAAAAAGAAVAGGDDDESYALEWRNRYLAARVKYLESRLAEAPKKKAPAKKKAAPKKKAAAKKKVPAKSKAAVASAAPTRKAAAKKAPAKKAPAKKAPAKKTDDDKYYINVKKFDGRAKRDVVAAIVKYCGVSLRSRDSSLVACTDESELKTVANGFVTKKLGIKTGQMELVKAVCQDMKGTRMKNRVTFYYLTAKKAGKLGVFGG